MTRKKSPGFSAGARDAVVPPKARGLLFEVIDRLDLARLKHWDQKVSDGGRILDVKHEAPGRSTSNAHSVDHLAQPVVLLLKEECPPFRDLVHGEVRAVLIAVWPRRSICFENQLLPSFLGDRPIEHSLGFGYRADTVAQSIGAGGEAKARGHRDDSWEVGRAPAGTGGRLPARLEFGRAPCSHDRRSLQRGKRWERLRATRRLRSGFGTDRVSPPEDRREQGRGNQAGQPPAYEFHKDQSRCPTRVSPTGPGRD